MSLFDFFEDSKILMIVSNPKKFRKLLDIHRKMNYLTVMEVNEHRVRLTSIDTEAVSMVSTTIERRFFQRFISTESITSMIEIGRFVDAVDLAKGELKIQVKGNSIYLKFGEHETAMETKEKMQELLDISVLDKFEYSECAEVVLDVDKMLKMAKLAKKIQYDLVFAKDGVTAIPVDDSIGIDMKIPWETRDETTRIRAPLLHQILEYAKKIGFNEVVARYKTDMPLVLKASTDDYGFKAVIAPVVDEESDEDGGQLEQNQAEV